MALKFLDSVGLAHVFDKIKALLAEKSDTGHTHNYAGSASVGGAATSANKLNTNAGSTSTPVYFENGVPKACTSLQLEVSGNAESATKDAAGNVITATYATKSEVTSATSTAKSYTDTAIANLIGSADSTMDTLGEIQTAMKDNADVVEALNAAIGSKAAADHTHNYAGSSSAGGAATSANKLNSNAGSATQPVYFANGVPVKTTYTLGASVPADAKFTDTIATLSSLGLTATAAELNVLDGITATTAELNYCDGVTSNIQTQLNGKLSTSGTAAKATADASGNNIVNTYAKKTELATALTTDEIDEILVQEVHNG